MLSGNRNNSVSPNTTSAERRTRRRLRDLCDEVLASYRVASDRDVITDADRADARMMLANIAPLSIAK